MSGQIVRPAAIAAQRGGPALSPAAKAAVAAGTPDTTRRAYNEDVNHFKAWCAETGNPGLPTTGTVLTEYATYLIEARGWAPVSIERARWAILKWHSLAEFPPPSTAGLVSALKGYRESLAKAESPKAEPQKAAAASRETLVSMLATLDRSTPAGMRDAAIILLGFGIGGRRSEIAGLSIGSLNFQERGVQVKVYRKKTRKMDNPVVQYRSDKAVCPVRAALAWIEVLAANGRSPGPLFVRINRHGHLGHQITRNGAPIGDPAGRMTGQAVGDVIHRCAISAGLAGKWTGHSLRRGLATSMHQAGAERSLIERQGGWEKGSRAVSGYIDDADRWLVDVLEGVL
jgi:site-specific recombinase XerD